MAPDTVRLRPLDGVGVLVAGDVMLDRYWHGDATRISPEAPVPVVHVHEVEERPGGAANVAVNVASLGARCTLLGVVGEDAEADALVKLLDAEGVGHRLARAGDVQTVTKLRVLSRHQQLIRLDREGDLPGDMRIDPAQHFEAALSHADVVVLSDYGKGSLRDIHRFIELARRAELPVLIDPKGGDFARYRGATVITPNLQEFELAVGRCSGLDTLVERATRLCREIDIEALLITRGEQGMVLVARDHSPAHAPARAREVYDVTGAGDTAIAAFATVLGAGYPMPRAMEIANHAAGLVVAKLGAASVTFDELRGALEFEVATHPSASGVVGVETLDQVLDAARTSGETVVMTNGCFDILHAGHVDYLEQARSLGDRLIVAVNDDASVSRLKGSGRPINQIADRMRVLAGLRAVDWVVPFSEDTPESLVVRVAPDVLVKGSDYQVEAIAGAASVRARGGRVEVIELREGLSTSAIIEASARLVGAPTGGAQS